MTGTSASLGRPVPPVLSGLLLLALFTTPAPAQTVRINEGYTAKIREYTTEPFFLTSWVDYLPASDTVPTVEDVLGHIAGAPDVLSYTHQVHHYLRTVAAVSPRVEVVSIGTSEEGREMIVVVVSSEETIRNLASYQQINARLADPRGLDEAEAQRLLTQAKPMYWVTGPRRLLYWGQYVSHDNNRDGLGLSLALSRNIMSTWFTFHPQVMHDLHESIAYLYTSTGTGPYSAWIDPILVDEWFELAFAEVSEFNRQGVPGVWTYGFYDGWAPNYMFYAANGHNAIGRVYETQTAGDGGTRVVSASSARAWYKPNPPLDRVLWSLRNNTNLMQSGVLTALSHVAGNHRKFMENFILKSRRSVAKARTEGPAAYIFPASDPRPGQQAELLNLLQRHGIEVHRAERAFTVAGAEYGAGSYLVRMDQPYSRMADLMLDRQYYNVSDPRPYDDVGWTMGPLFGAETVRIEESEVLDVRMRKIEAEVRPTARHGPGGHPGVPGAPAEGAVAAGERLPGGRPGGPPAPHHRALRVQRGPAAHLGRAGRRRGPGRKRRGSGCADGRGARAHVRDQPDVARANARLLYLPAERAAPPRLPRPGGTLTVRLKRPRPGCGTVTKGFRM